MNEKQLFQSFLGEEQKIIDTQLDDIEKNLSEILQPLRDVFIAGFGKQEGVKEKTPGDFVTETDMQIESMFREWVGTRYPEHGVYGEEEEGEEDEIPEWLWAIDPIDGTNNYQFGNSDTSIVISLRYRGQPVLALCELPMKNDNRGIQYYARVGRGMKKNGAEVNSTEITEMKHVPLVTMKLDRPRRMMSMVGNIWDTVAGIHMSMSSVYEACRVASGEMGIGAFYSCGPYEWPAMYLFAKESGCTIGELGKPDQAISFNGMESKNLLIAGNQSLYNQVKELIHVPDSL